MHNSITHVCFISITCIFIICIYQLFISQAWILLIQCDFGKDLAQSFSIAIVSTFFPFIQEKEIMKSSRKKVSIAHLITIFVILLVCLHAYLVSIVAKHVTKESETVVYKNHFNNYQNRKHHESALEGEENLINSALPLDATDKDHEVKDPLPVDHDKSFPKATIAYGK